MTQRAEWSGEAVVFQAKDGQYLHGSYFHGLEERRELPILICPATGIRQTFYYSFARWLTNQGYPVLVFDYRGIGASLAHSDLRTCSANKQDWGELDMPAALDWLLEKIEQAQAVLIGHSAGAQLVGLMPNHRSIRHCIAVSASSGYVGNIRFPLRFAAWFFVWFYIPLTLCLFGYLPAKRMGWGENLPPGIARQWARWCRTPGYAESDFGQSIRQTYYHEVTCPITLLYSEDDALLTQPNIEDWLRLMPMARTQVIWLCPVDWGCCRIGHVNLFRNSHVALWPLFLNAIENNLDATGKPSNAPSVLPKIQKKLPESHSRGSLPAYRL